MDLFDDDNARTSLAVAHNRSVSFDAAAGGSLEPLGDHPHRSHIGFDGSTLVHAYLSALAFALLFPLTATSARFVNKSRPVELCRRVWGSWLRVHTALASAGLACVAVALGCIEWHKVSGGHGHLRSWHAIWGAAAYALAPLQMLLGAVRPAKAVEPTRARRAWWTLHACTGVGALAAGLVSASLGIDKAILHQVGYAHTVSTLYTAWLVLGGLAFAAIEVRRQRWLGKCARHEEANAGLQTVRERSDASGEAGGRASGMTSARGVHIQKELPAEVYAEAALEMEGFSEGASTRGGICSAGV